VRKIYVYKSTDKKKVATIFESEGLPWVKEFENGYGKVVADSIKNIKFDDIPKRKSQGTTLVFGDITGEKSDGK